MESGNCIAGLGGVAFRIGYRERASAMAHGKTPWHMWLVALVSLLWNAQACFVYWMTMTRDAAYLAPFPPEMIDWLDAVPDWALVAWGLGVFAALAGSVLLLLRSGFAVLAFAASLLGLAGSQFHQWTSDAPDSMTNTGSMVLAAAFWIVAIGLLWYAAAMRRRGVLR